RIRARAPNPSRTWSAPAKRCPRPAPSWRRYGARAERPDESGRGSRAHRWRSSLKIPMTTPRLLLLAIFLAAALPAAAQHDATALVAIAVAAVEEKQQNEKHWNWSSGWRRRRLNNSGEPVEMFPSVTSEAVILSDGRHCNPVTA